MRSVISKPETWLLAACAVLLALAVFGPVVSQDAGYHAFADSRTLWGLPFALDVVSNLPFAIAGFVGAIALWRVPPEAVSNVQRAMAALFFAGLVLTAGTSGWYHLEPDEERLAMDRVGMSLAFAGLLGLGAAARISERAGAVLGLAVLVLGPIAAQYAGTVGDMLPWAILQAGGMVLVVVFACMPRRPGSLDVHWLAVIAAYGVAKLLELNDVQVYRFTGEWISGHTLKHVMASFAAIPVISAVWARNFFKHYAASQKTSRLW